MLILCISQSLSANIKRENERIIVDWLSVYWFWAVARPDIAPLFVNGFHGGRKSCGTGFSWAERSGARGLREPSIVQTRVPARPGRFLV